MTCFKKQLACTNENRFIFFLINEWKNIKCSSFNKIQGNRYTVKSSHMFWPTLSLLTVLSLQAVKSLLCHSGRPSNYQTRNSQTRWKRLLLEEKQFVVLFLHKKVHLSAKSACQETTFKYKIVLVWFCVCVCHCAV